MLVFADIDIGEEDTLVDGGPQTTAAHEVALRHLLPHSLHLFMRLETNDNILGMIPDRVPGVGEKVSSKLRSVSQEETATPEVKVDQFSASL